MERAMAEITQINAFRVSLVHTPEEIRVEVMLEGFGNSHIPVSTDSSEVHT
jgi:hypothetical protein